MNGKPLRSSRVVAAVHRTLNRAVTSVTPFLAGALLTASAGAQNTDLAADPEIANPAEAQAILQRGDIVHLPTPLKDTLARMAGRPSTYDPMRAFAEADKPSQLFQYYLLNTSGFQPNIFTAIVPGINDHAIPTAANAANHQLRTIGAVRVVLEPKPGLPTDPQDVEAFIDIFTDLSGLFVINNESGWYEGWMIHDLDGPGSGSAAQGRSAQFGKITSADAHALAAMGTHHNVPGKFFTTDGKDLRFPSAQDHFPDKQSNTVPLALSMGAYNCLQQSDCHAYWEFNEYTNWVFPLYELPSRAACRARSRPASNMMCCR